MHNLKVLKIFLVFPIVTQSPIKKIIKTLIIILFFLEKTTYFLNKNSLKNYFN